jgi:hypothetical protein
MVPFGPKHGSLNLGCSYLFLVTDTQGHNLESNTGFIQAHLFPTKQTHWFSEALFIHVASCIHDEISIYDMEL